MSTSPRNASTTDKTVVLATGTSLPPPSPDIPPVGGSLTPTAMILLTVSTVAALYLGRDVLIPLALAILLSFALGPPVTWLYRRGMPRVPAILAVMLVVTLLIGGFGALVASQLTHLAQQLPTYEANLRAKAQTIAEAAPSGGLFSRAADLLRDVNREIDKIAGPATPDKPSLTSPGDTGRPIPVEIHEPPESPLEALATFAGPLVQPIATAGIVIVFIIFVLLQREDLRDRMIRLFGMNDVHRATAAISDAAKRVGRYLLMQLVVNLLYGLPVGLGLFLIGVPNALLWGLLATVLRFVPYLGPILAAVCPIALSLAVDTGWTTPLLTVSLFIVLELFTNNVLEPWLYGSSTGLSPLAIIVAAVFWTTLWGPVGLLLATPLTVCLVVLGRHVPQLQIFEVLLGDTPVLAPKVKFYQRLLASDPHDAEELADDALDEQPLADVFNGIILPALVFAEQDRQRGALPPARAREIAGWVQEIVDDLVEAADETAKVAPQPPRMESARVLCLGARGAPDVAAATMLAHLLRRGGIAAEVGEVGSLLRAPGTIGGFDAVCVSYLDATALRQARRVVGRLRLRLAPDTVIGLGLWGLPAGEAETAMTTTRADFVVGALGLAVRKLGELEPGPSVVQPAGSAG